MRKNARTFATLACLAAVAVAPIAAHAVPIVMDFGATGGATTTPSTPFIQNDITMTPLMTNGHWDHYRTAPFGTAADNSAVIHRGNNAEAVRFTFSGGAFDLLSLFAEGFLISNANSGGLTATFVASSGATHTLHSSAAALGVVSDSNHSFHAGPGLIDFTLLSGWTNITFFDISVPLGIGACSISPLNDCSNFGFDDITIQRHVPGSNGVPEPATLALFGFALAGLGVIHRRHGEKPG